MIGEECIDISADTQYMLLIKFCLGIFAARNKVLQKPQTVIVTGTSIPPARCTFTQASLLESKLILYLVVFVFICILFNTRLCLRLRLHAFYPLLVCINYFYNDMTIWLLAILSIIYICSKYADRKTFEAKMYTVDSLFLSEVRLELILADSYFKGRKGVDVCRR